MQFHLPRAFGNGTDGVGVNACSFICSGHLVMELEGVGVNACSFICSGHLVMELGVLKSLHAVSVPSIRQWDGRVLENWVNIYDGSRFVYGKCGIFVM